MRFDRGLAALFASTLTALAGCSSTCSLTVSGESENVRSLYLIVTLPEKLAKENGTAEQLSDAMVNAGGPDAFDGWAQMELEKQSDNTIVFKAPVAPHQTNGIVFEPSKGTSTEAIIEFPKDLEPKDTVFVLIDRGEVGRSAAKIFRWQFVPIPIKDICEGRTTKVFITESELQKK